MLNKIGDSRHVCFQSVESMVLLSFLSTRCRTPCANQLGWRKPPCLGKPPLSPPNFCCINCILSTKVINECDQGQQEPGLFYSPDSGTKYSHLKSRRQKPSKTFQAGGPFFRASVQSASSAKQNMIRRKGRRTKWKKEERGAV